mmetsp:Transcript_27211/g.26256  ORF Transcript_27211/g.26256 Transcript_27211/m.26256 type:complete len:83 (-) Transcript_27211:1190-1438(-)
MVDSLDMPSIVQETNEFANMFIDQKKLQGLDDSKKKAKKIEFSQSIKPLMEEKSLPFTHDKIDELVFNGSMKNRDFDINQAK